MSLSSAEVKGTPGGRKLVAVVHADIVGYSRLIGLDDAGTLERVQTLRRNLIDPAISEHGGRIVNTAGDAILMVFDSVEGAVRCAANVQQQIPIHDGHQPPDRRIRFRVGINVGDVIVDGSDVHGDGVNVAARLQAECPAGGICASRSVRDHVHGRLDLTFEPIGELALKNIARPVEAFVLRLDRAAEAQARIAPTPTQVKPQQHAATTHFRPALIAVVMTTLLVCVATAAWWLVREPAAVRKTPDTPPAMQASRPAQPAVTQAANLPSVGLSNAPRLSVVVLPFDNLGGEGVDSATVDGITEDLTTDISHISGFFVISRNSAFTYKGKAIDIKRIGEELGVRYAVEGSVRNVGGALRVSAQLVSTETGAHLWAERFDVRRDGAGYDVDDIVHQIRLALGRGAVVAEGARIVREPPANPDAADFLLQARALSELPLSPQTQKQVVALYERALELDPSSAFALAGLAEALLDQMPVWTDDPADPARLRRAEQLMAQAELLRPDDGKVMWVRVYLLGKQNRCPELIPAAKRSIEAYPTSTASRLWLGLCLMLSGRAADAVSDFEQAIRIDPRNPSTWNRYLSLGWALIFVGRDDEAVAALQKSLAANPGNSALGRSTIHAAIAAAQALAGHGEEAHLSSAEATRLWPTLTARGNDWLLIVKNPIATAEVSRMIEGMRLAGIRDHAEEDADFGVPSDDALHTNYEAPTPTTVPGARTIRTPDLAKLVEQRKPLVLDTIRWGRSISGAVGLWGAGVGGSTSDEYQGRLKTKMQQLTKGDLNLPVVSMGWNSERYQGRNLALRLVALGYTNVYWYRGGREAWEVAGLPETELALQDW